MDLKARGRITAKDTCIICFWATMAGAISEDDNVSKLGKAPGDTSTGHCNRHYDAAVGVYTKDPLVSSISCPMYVKREAKRMVCPLAVMTPQALLEKEVSETDGFTDQLQEVSAKLPPCYRIHPVVLQLLPLIAIPLAFFMDGVEYAKKDQVIGVSC